MFFIAKTRCKMALLGFCSCIRAKANCCNKVVATLKGYGNATMARAKMAFGEFERKYVGAMLYMRFTI